MAVPRATAPEAGSGEDVAAGPQSPLNLNAVESAGATRFGSRVRLLLMVMEDGRKVRLELPVGEGDPPATGKDWTRTKPGRAILAAMGEVDRPLKGETIAKLADYAYNGSFRAALKGLETQGEIRKADDDSGYELCEQQ